jgi:hypothetical protein
LLLNVPQLQAEQANLSHISIGQLSIGPLNVGQLVLTNVAFSMPSCKATLKDIRVTLTVAIGITWRVGLSIDLGFVSIPLGPGAGNTINLDEFTIPVPDPFPDITIPLTNITLSVPSLAAQTILVSADPLSDFGLSNAHLEGVETSNIKLPSGGFTLAGLALTSVDGSAVTVPAASIDEARVGHLSGDAVRISAFALHDLNLQAAQFSEAIVSADVSIPLPLLIKNIEPVGVGPISLGLSLKPTLNMEVKTLEISGADVSARGTIDRMVLNDVAIPYAALNLTLSQLGIDTLQVPSFSVG